MSFLAAALDFVFAQSVRTGSLSCTCGSVRLEINTPFSSHGIIEQTTCICHCRDCVGFCQSLPGGNILIRNDGTQLIQFYKKDVSVIKGKEQIGSVRLRKNTPLVRCYCKKCQTPLGAEIDSGPILLLYADLIQAPYPIFLPSLVLFFSKSDKARQYASSVVVRQGLIAPLFLLRVLGRVLLGFLLGKNQGGMLENDYSQTVIGLPLDGITSKPNENDL